MYTIIEKEQLDPTVTKLVVSAPNVARKAQPGQFVILRPDEDTLQAARENVYAGGGAGKQAAKAMEQKLAPPAQQKNR
jgi:NAD(P)H-flavin reductase